MPDWLQWLLAAYLIVSIFDNFYWMAKRDD